MATYAIGSTYTYAQQLAILKAEQRTVRFEYEIIDGSTGLSKGMFYDVQAGGSIEYGYLNEIKRTASFTINENLNDLISKINFLLDRMQIWCCFDFYDRGPKTLRFAVGQFVMSSSNRKVDGNLVTRDVQGFDLCKILKDDSLVTRYEVPAGASISTSVASILTNAGITQMVIDPTTAPMKATRSWEPGTSKLVVVNELLELAGRGSVFFDGQGVARSRAYVAPANRTATIDYRTDSESVLTPEFSSEIDLGSVPNQWTFVVSQPDVPVLSAVYQNTNILSPTSIPNRGRIINYFANDNQDATTLAELMALAEKKAAEDSQVYETVSVNTLIMPIHDENETVYLYHDDAMGAGFNYSEMAWNLPLTHDGVMSHSLRRVVAVTSA